MPVMTDAELCQAVSEKVMGLPRIDTWYPNTSDLELSWSDAGRVVERMLGLGFKYACHEHRIGDVYVWFSWERPPSRVDDEVVALADTFPRAVFEAALKAVEARNADA